MAFTVTKEAAWAVLFCVLICFTLLALASAQLLDCILPPALTRCCVLKRKDGEATANVLTTDYFLSARNSAGVTSLALSYFASGMGAWILYGTTEMGATPQLSWLGVLGYSSASAFPAVIIGVWLGPKIREMSMSNFSASSGNNSDANLEIEGQDNKASNSSAFSTTDFGLVRYGRVMQVTIAAISGFYMFIFVVAELTSIGNIFGLLTGSDSQKYTVGVTVTLAALTMLYTTIAGLPASIVTDKFQGVMVLILVVILTFALTTSSDNVSREKFDRVSNFTGQGFKAAVTLVLAIASAELFNQATWQRVWAAESVKSMRIGFLLGSVMVFFLMMFFGIIGMIAYANDPESYDNFEKFAFLAFFDLLEPLSTGWQVTVLILVTALAASSIDSLQNGLTSIFSHDLIKFGYSPQIVARVFMVLINIPAIILAAQKFDVIALFLVADLVCATSVLPVFLGLQRTDIGILKAPTELGAFLGCISGIVTVLINGAVNDTDGSLWDYFWLRNNGICALCGTKTMVSFIITPVVSALMTYVFSFLDIAIRGDRARKPIFTVGFDQEGRAGGDIPENKKEQPSFDD